MTQQHSRLAADGGSPASSETRSGRATAILHACVVSVGAACLYFFVYQRLLILVVDRLGSLRHSYSAPTLLMSLAGILTLSGGIAILQLSHLRSSFFANTGLVVFWAPSVMAAVTLGGVSRPTRTLLLMVCIFFIVVVVLRPIDVSRIIAAQPQVGVSAFMVLIAVPWAVSMAYIVYRNGLHVRIPALTEIYDVEQSGARGTRAFSGTSSPGRATSCRP